MITVERLTKRYGDLTAWGEAGTAHAAGDLEAAIAKARTAEGMAQDLVARLGMSAA